MERKINKAEISSERKHNLVTFNPTSAKMGEKLYVTIPKVDPSLCIVPGTTNLVYNLKNSNDKSWPFNNLNRLFVQGMQVKIGREVVYDNTGKSVYRLYKDLWMSEEKRNAKTSHGICPEEMRKHLGGSSDASKSSKTGGALDSLLATKIKNQRIALGQILDDHGLHSPAHVNFETRYTITLPDNSTNIGDMQSSQTVGNFRLENLQLEYDTIRNESAAKSAASSYDSGKKLVLEHVSLETVSEWDKDATSINENLHINRESMKAIVMLFKWVDQKMDEDFIYPNITEVSTSVNGKPNAIHSSAIKTDDLEREARRYFGNDNVSTGKFFSTQFALVLDFRSVKDQFKCNDGVKVDGSSGIQVAIKREATSKNVKCYVFVISDSIASLSAVLIFSYRVAKASNLSNFEIFVLKNAARLTTIYTFALLSTDLLKMAGVDENKYETVDEPKDENKVNEPDEPKG